MCSHSVVSDPATVARQAPLSMGFPRQEYWSGLPRPPPGDLPDPGIKPGSSTLQADSLPSEPRYTGSAQLMCLGWMNEVLSQLRGTSIPLVCPTLLEPPLTSGNSHFIINFTKPYMETKPTPKATSFVTKNSEEHILF